MPLDSKHPFYAIFQSDWIQMSDTYEGERVVKDRGTDYLPATSGQILDGMESNNTGRVAYDAYKCRAVFHDFVSEAVEKFIGIMHQKPPVIELPAQMEAMRDSATNAGEGLIDLLRKINEIQLVQGRLGLLMDIPVNPPADILPYIAIYNATSIINWDEGARQNNKLSDLNLVVLDESSYVRKGNFEWEQEKIHRVLILGEIEENESETEKVIYQAGVFRKTLDFTSIEMAPISIRGSTLDEIPFIFVNSKDLLSSPDNPPLLGLSNLALAIYRGEADYRQALFMQGQDTLVTIGDFSPTLLGEADSKDNRIGAGAALNLPQNGDAKFIGTSSKGLPEMRAALENDKNKADSMGSTILKRGGNSNPESGDALAIRAAAETATLNQVALAGAGALQKILRIGAKWLGANPKEVIVTPNLDFVVDEITGKELKEFQEAKLLGTPISNQSIHTLMKKRGLTDLSLEEEEDLIASEEPLEGTEEGGNPNDGKE